MAAKDPVAVDGGTEKYTFFWQGESPFSQWHSSKFSVDGITYNCAEQYMMHQKALLFGDKDIADKIMAYDSPRKQKSLGRKVSNFDAAVWDRECRGVVKKGNMAKFSQNEALWEQLAATAGTVLVEASPLDTIWGIGLTADSPDAQHKATWRGKNWLGYALTEAREELMKQKAQPQGT